MRVAIVASCEIYLRGLVAVLTEADMTVVAARTSLESPLRPPADVVVIGADPTVQPDLGPETERGVLSMREYQVLRQIAEGRTQGQIARALGISHHTVDSYLRRIRAKLGLGNKAELTRAAMLGHLNPGRGMVGSSRVRLD